MFLNIKTNKRDSRVVSVESYMSREDGGVVFIRVALGSRCGSCGHGRSPAGHRGYGHGGSLPGYRGLRARGLAAGL